jgi:hypothetical protein
VSPTPSPTAPRPTVPPGPTKPVGFSAAFAAGPSYCVNSQTVLDATGRTRGFVECANPNVSSDQAGMFSVASQTFGGRWKLTRIGPVGRLLAVADDGTATYGLSLEGGNPAVLKLVKRTHAGKTSITTLDRDAAGADGSLAASHGQWWALWSKPDGGCACFHLFESRTMGSHIAPHFTGRVGRQPDMIALSATAVQVVRNTGFQAEGGPIAVTTADAGGWHADVMVLATSGSSPYGYWPRIVRGDGVTSISWLQRNKDALYDIAYADDRGGVWRRHTFAAPASSRSYRTYGPYGPPYLAFSQGRLYLGWSTPVNGRGIGHVVELYRGHWSEANLSDGQRDGDAVFVGLVAFQGRAQVVLENRGGSRATATWVRHQ